MIKEFKFNIFKKMNKIALVSALGTAVLGGAPADASIIELKMTTPVFSVGNVPYLRHNPYIHKDDIAKFTIRYDTSTALSGTIETAAWSSGIYNGAVTYFGFDLERDGSTVYSGSTSGNFGRVRVYNDKPVAPPVYTDFLVIDLFDDDDRYNFHGLAPRDPGLTEMPPLPMFETGDSINGDILLETFKFNFMGVSRELWSDISLPDMSVLTDGSFASKLGNTPWTAGAIFPDSANSFFSTVGFGYSAETPRGEGPWGHTYSVSEYREGGQDSGDQGDGNTPLPEPGMFLLMGLGLVGIGVSRRKKQG